MCVSLNIFLSLISAPTILRTLLWNLVIARICMTFCRSGFLRILRIRANISNCMTPAPRKNWETTKNIPAPGSPSRIEYCDRKQPGRFASRYNFEVGQFFESLPSVSVKFLAPMQSNQWEFYPKERTSIH